MLSSADFDHFLKHGFIPELAAGTSMNVLLERFGEDEWYVKNIENNGLIYGIIKMGFVEFHIYDEVVSGISYRPDLPYIKKQYKGITVPWISKIKSIEKIESELISRDINYTKYNVTGPVDFKTAGAAIMIYSGEHTFIDTEGGVSFLFDDDFEAYQICRYYDEIYSRIMVADNFEKPS